MNKKRTETQRYYDAVTQDYLRYYESDWHQHMHYGFERDLPKGGNPSENLVKYMSQIADIKPGEKMLDAGCGVGGSTVWNHQNRATVNVALNFVEEQLHIAKRLSAKNGATDLSFSCGDFHKCPFKAESFDVIWALESYCHAQDKKKWVAEMFRLLKPGGRLIIGDGFRSEGEFSQKQQKKYDTFIKGWAVPHLGTFKEVESYYLEAGFEKVYVEDITKDVYPHALAIFRFGLIFTPLRWLGNLLGLVSREKLGNAQATYHQYTTLKEDLWKYGIFCGQKPKS